MPPSTGVRRVVALGVEGRAVGLRVRHLRAPDVMVAGFVGDDEQAARALGEEMLGGVDEVVLGAESARQGPAPPHET